MCPKRAREQRGRSGRAGMWYGPSCGWQRHGRLAAQPRQLRLRGGIPHVAGTRSASDSAWNSLSVLGPMARTVQDAALFLSAMAGPDTSSPLSIHEPGSRFAQPLERYCKGLRIAWCPKFGGSPFDRRIRDVFDAQRKKFETLGCITEDADPDFSGADEAFKVLRALSFYQQYGSLPQAQRR